MRRRACRNGEMAEVEAMDLRSGSQGSRPREGGSSSRTARRMQHGNVHPVPRDDDRDMTYRLKAKGVTGIGYNIFLVRLTALMTVAATGVTAPQPTVSPSGVRATNTASVVAGRDMLVKRAVSEPVVAPIGGICIGLMVAMVMFGPASAYLLLRVVRVVTEWGWGDIRPPHFDVLGPRAAIMDAGATPVPLLPRHLEMHAATGVSADQVVIGHAAETGSPTAVAENATGALPAVPPRPSGAVHRPGCTFLTWGSVAARTWWRLRWRLRRMQRGALRRLLLLRCMPAAATRLRSPTPRQLEGGIVRLGRDGGTAPRAAPRGRTARPTSLFHRSMALDAARRRRDWRRGTPALPYRSPIMLSEC